MSRSITNELFFLMYKIFRNKKAALYLVSLVYFPGTVVHEISHFFAAAALLLKVHSISVIPEIDHTHVKLGSVQYVKADYIRGLLVGIAPFFVGLFIFYAFASQNILAHSSFLIKIIAVYFIFVLSSTMFSSKKDLADLIFVLPVLIIIPILLYIFNIDLTPVFANQTLKNVLSETVARINYYLLISVLINCAIFCIVKLLRGKSHHI